METRYVKCANYDHEGNVESVGYANEMHEEPVGTKSKQEVIDDIRRGVSYEIAVRETQEWRTEEIHVYDGDWIRVDADEEPEDELDKIPECEHPYDG